MFNTVCASCFKVLLVFVAIHLFAAGIYFAVGAYQDFRAWLKKPQKLYDSLEEHTRTRIDTISFRVDEARSRADAQKSEIADLLKAARLLNERQTKDSAMISDRIWALEDNQRKRLRKGKAHK